MPTPETLKEIRKKKAEMFAASLKAVQTFDYQNRQLSSQSSANLALRRALHDALRNQRRFPLWLSTGAWLIWTALAFVFGIMLGRLT